MPLEIPISALAVPGEGDEMVAPEVGETVEVMLTGKVESIENGKARIAAESVNGEPVAYSETAKPKSNIPTEEDMLGMAEKADEDETQSML